MLQKNVYHLKLSQVAESFNRSGKGQALVEFAGTLPILFVLIVLAMNFGGLMNAWINVSNATRSAADFASLGGAAAHRPTAATSTTLKALINADLAYLPNLSSTNPAMCVRELNNNISSTLLESPSGACANFAAPVKDAEDIATGSTVPYSNLAVDITYTYIPFYTVTKLSGLSLAATPTSVHQRALMRILQ